MPPTDSGRFIGLLISSAAIASAILVIALAFWTVIRRRASTLSLCFAVLSSCVTSWLVCLGWALRTGTSEEFLFWCRWVNGIVAFIPFLLMLVACQLTGTVRRFRLLLAVYGVAGLFWSLFSVCTNEVITGTRRFPWGYYTRYGPAEFGFLYLLISAMPFASWLLWRAQRQAPTPQSRARLRLLGVAFGIAYLAIIDYLPAYGLPMLPLGFLAISAFVVIAGYTILRYQLVPLDYAFAAEQIVGTIADAIFVCDRQGIVLMGNDSAGRLVGCAPAQLPGQPLQRWLTVPRPEPLSGFEQEMRWRVESGGERITNVSATPVVEADGEPVGMVLVVRDITERRTAERQRRTLEDSLRQLSIAVEQSANLVVITDLSGRIEYVNPRFTEVTGFTKQEAVGQTPRILSSGDTPPGVYQMLWETILSGRVWRGELLNRRKDGSRYWAQVTISPIRDAQGALTHFIGIQEDVTDRKQAEQALRSERDRVRTYLDTAAVCLVAIDGTGKVTMINRQGCLLLEAREEEIVGRDWFELAVPAEDRDRVRDIHRRLMAGEIAQVDHAENFVITRQGRRRLVAWNNAVLRDESGRALATISSGEDVTERREHEHRVRQAQELLTHAQRLDRLARELSAPLRTISQGLEQLQQQASRRPDPALIRAMRDAMTRASQAIKELSALYGPGSGR